MIDDFKHQWFDWLFIATVGLFTAAIIFTVVECAFAVRLGRIVAALLISGFAGVVAMSVAEEFDLQFRYDREEKNGKPF